MKTGYGVYIMIYSKNLIITGIVVWLQSAVVRFTEDWKYLVINMQLVLCDGALLSVSAIFWLFGSDLPHPWRFLWGQVGCQSLSGLCHQTNPLLDPPLNHKTGGCRSRICAGGGATFQSFLSFLIFKREKYNLWCSFWSRYPTSWLEK